MENIFETLYYGPQSFDRYEYQESEKYHREASRTYDKLKSTLTEEQQKLLFQYADQASIAYTKDEFLQYCDGFRFAIRLILAAMTTEKPLKR